MRLAKMGVYDAQGVPGQPLADPLSLCCGRSVRPCGLALPCDGCLCRIGASPLAKSIAHHRLPADQQGDDVLQHLPASPTAPTRPRSLAADPLQGQPGGPGRASTRTWYGAGPAGVYHATNLPVALTVGSAAPALAAGSAFGRWIHLTWTVQDTTAGVPVAPGPSRGQLPRAWPPTRRSPTQALNWGVEQSLTLVCRSGSRRASPARSPTPVLTMAQDCRGQWGLYAPGDPDPVFVLVGHRGLRRKQRRQRQPRHLQRARP